MKLYLARGACSLSPHIALAESGLSFEIEKVDLRSKLTEGGLDFRQINPKGSVPALLLDNGEVLTEGPAIVQYIADQKPEKRLAPPAGSLARYRLQEWLNYISSELHKGFAPLFRPDLTDDAKKAAVAAFETKLDFVAGKLKGRDYLMGSQFSVADGYLFTVLSWTKFAGIDLAKWPSIRGFVERVGARPAVQAAQQAEM
jgi:glutathione S-transferase